MSKKQNNTKTKKKIIVLSYKFSRHARAKRIYKTLLDAGYDVASWEGKRVIERGPRLLRGVINYLASMVDVARLNADVYWVESVPDFVYLPLVLKRKPLIYDRRSPWSLQVGEELGTVGRLLVRPLARIAEMILARRACAVAAASTPLAKDTKRIAGGREVVVIPNYPENAFRCNPSERGRVRDELGVPRSSKVFIFVGTLNNIEGVDLLEPIAEQLRDTGSFLWIAGDGPARRVVERLAERYKHVRWFGWVQRGRLTSLLSAADYGLVLLKTPRLHTHEDILKIGEYVRCGLPVIAAGGLPPSPYYLSVDRDDIPRVVRDIALGRVEVPKPPPIPTWEEVSGPRVLQVVDRCLSGLR